MRRTFAMASETQTTRTEYPHIVRTPGVLGGQARIADHRIRVRDVVAARDSGNCSAEEIVSSVYPSLSLAEVYAALAYYEDHRDEIDREAEQEAEQVERFVQEHPGLVRDLRPEKR